MLLALIFIMTSWLPKTSHSGTTSLPIFATCPFCDPDFQDVPNLQSALKGYDLPSGDPDRKYFPSVSKYRLSYTL